MSETKNFLVFGATGKQGSAAVQWLSKSDTSASIYAVTRDTSSAKAQSLSSLPNVKLVQGDSSEPEKVFSQVQDKIDGLFFLSVGFDSQAQIKEGKEVVDLSVQYGIKHFVLSSTDYNGYRNKDTDISSIEAKKTIEDYLTSSSLNYTIIRPVGFLENLYFPGYADAIPHFWPAQLLKSGISSSDIGRAASEILIDPTPTKFNNQVIGLSGHEGKPEDWMKVWQQVNGEDLRNREKKMGNMPEERMKLLKFIMFNENDARVAETKALFPWVTDLKTFLESGKKAQ
ncbi:uncharacterized protein IL334_006162 [Kwoniella shivajii]|uniref:NmrA-like domain-containing protein n=1 Tax=Kwoniella shivajii TaxID=564305 RepID=A0ABZ1D5U4_9TREE|nr:hypothetical protein IL334_006162 [Kwoniella shivajii]